MHPDPELVVLHKQNFAGVGAPSGKFSGEELRDECNQQHHVKRRINLQPTADEKTRKTDRAALEVLLIQ